MTDSDPAEGPRERHSVLSELPRIRPQRKSARREAARAKAEQHAPRKPATATRKSTAKAGAAATDEKRLAPSRRRTTPRTRRAGANAEATTPRQGYEAESEALGTPVAPPSGAELVGSLAELAGELAQTGISAGGRLLRRAMSRLSKP